jgi:hypothetical protein
LIVGPHRRLAFVGLAVNPNLTHAEHLFEGSAVTSHRLLKYLGDAVAVNLIVAQARSFSRGTEQ